MKKNKIHPRLTGCMRGLAVIAVLLLSALPSLAGIKIVSLKGDVTVRRGAAERWVTVALGDALRPEDSIRLGEGADATVVLEDGPGTGKKVRFPAMVIVDAADLRNITRTDLLMKLAMEDVRSAPTPTRGGGDMPNSTPKTTTTRAGDRDPGPTRNAEGGMENGMRLNGAKVLHENGYFGPCVLRSREILRIEPELARRFDARILMADALEKMDLKQEAYDAYKSLDGEKLTAVEKTLVGEKLEELKK